MKNFTAATALLFCSLSCWGWGQKGHDVTAYIAERNLTPTAAQAISDLLDGKSIVYWANWLDNSSNTPEYAYTKTWHYKNIDADQDFDEAPNIPEGNIVIALNEQIPLLSNPNISKEEKALALKIVVHLLGDVHQPMHMGHFSDIGGNRWFVKFFGSNANLHGSWDSRIPESAHKWSYSEWTDQLNRATDEERAAIQSGTPTDWAKETFEICKTVYDETPEGENISYDYIYKWTPTVEHQFLRGGLRLADVLNNAFDPLYTGTTTVDAAISSSNESAD